METVKVEGNLPARIEALKRSTQVSWQRLGLKMDGLETGLGAMNLKERKTPGDYSQRRIIKRKNTPAPYPSKSLSLDAAVKDTCLPPIPTAPLIQPHVEHTSRKSVRSSKDLHSNTPTVRNFESPAAQLPQDLKNGDSMLQAGEPLVSLPIGAKDVTNHQLGRGFIPYEPTKSVL
jgi:hypothetical protein